jgi:hypothetical protein
MKDYSKEAALLTSALPIKEWYTSCSSVLTFEKEPILMHW